MIATPLDTIDIGIVVERRESNSQWIDFTWRVADVLLGAPDGPWRELTSGEGWTRFFAGATTVELYRRETEGYRRNLSEPVPAIYLVMQHDEDTEGLVPFLATVCPYEGEAYEESGDDVIESAPMPLEMVQRVQAFVDTHHVDEPFKKRKQKRKDKAVDHG